MPDVEALNPDDYSTVKEPVTKIDRTEHTPEAAANEEEAHEQYTEQEAQLPPVERLQEVQLEWEGKRSEFLQQQPEAQQARKDELKARIALARDVTAGNGAITNLPPDVSRKYNEQMGTRDALAEANRQSLESLNQAAQAKYEADMQKVQRRSRLTLGLGGGKMRHEADTALANSNAHIETTRQQHEQGMYALNMGAESIVRDHSLALEMLLRAEETAQERTNEQAPETAAAVERADQGYDNALNAIDSDEIKQIDEVRKLGLQDNETTDAPYYERINKIKETAEARRQQALIERMKGPYTETIAMHINKRPSITPADTISQILKTREDQMQPIEDRRAA